MKTLDRKLLREIWRSKGLLSAIITVLTVGVGCYASMNGAYQNLSQAKARYYRQCRLADFWIDVKKAPLAELESLARLPGVVEIQPRIQFFATIDVERSPEPLNGLVISLPDQRSRPLNDIVLVQGGYFTDRRDNEVILNEKFARFHGLYPGMTVHFLLNNRRQELFIVGTAIAAEFTYVIGPGTLVPDPAHFGVAYLKRSFAEEVFNMQGAANQVVGRLEPQLREHPDDVLRQAETLLDAYGVADVTPLKLQASNQYLSNEIRGLATFASILPAIFLAVAAVVLNVLLTRLARQQRPVIGTLKALGYSDLTVFMHFLKFGMVIGVAGALCGSLLGYRMSAFMVSIYQFVFEFPDLSNEIFIQSHALAWACSVGCAGIGSLVGASAALRLNPAEAMRPEPPRKGGRVLLERYQAFWNTLTAAWRMVIRNLFRNKVRTLAGVFAAAMGTALMINGFMMKAGLNAIVTSQFQLVVRSDLDLSLFDERSAEALTEVRSLPLVDYVEPTLTVACTFQHGPYRRKGAITGLVGASRLTVPRNAQDLPIRLATTGLTINRHLAGLLHVSRGDTLTVIPVKGDRRAREFPVVQITDGLMGLAAYAEIGYLSRELDQELVLNGVQLLSSADGKHREALYREIKQMPAIQSTASRQEMIDNLNGTLVKTQNFFVSMFVVFAGAIFFSSVLNASLVSLAERQREVATFLALGYTPWRVGNMFLRESLVSNGLGTVMGLPLGYGLTWVIAVVYANDMVRFPVVFPDWVWQLACAFSLVYAAAAHAIVQWKIATLDYQESLKVRE